MIKGTSRLTSFAMLLFFPAIITLLAGTIIGNRNHSFPKGSELKIRLLKLLALVSPRKLEGKCDASLYLLLNSQTMCRIWNLWGPLRFEIQPGTEFNMHRGIFQWVKAGPFALVSLRNLSLSFCSSFVSLAATFFLVCRLKFFTVLPFIPLLPWDNSPGGEGKNASFCFES